MMITPAKLDLTIRRGADFSLTFDIDIDGTTLNLTGANVQSEIRRIPSRTAPLLAVFTVDLDSITHEITLSLNETQTAELPVCDAAYDVLVSLAGVDIYYLEGTVRISDSVTVGV